MATLPSITKKQAYDLLAHKKGLIPKPYTFKLEDYLFDKQLAFVLDPAPFKMAVTTRRAGKSTSCVTDLTHTAINSPGSTCLYITLSRKNAKRLVWPEFKKLNHKFTLGIEFNESDLSATFPNGSIVYLLGAADRNSIEDFRGLAIKKVYLDESQSFPSYIEQLIDDVLGPALMDHDGQLILIGTPGPVPAGYFYDLTKNDSWAHHSWSFFDNPKLAFLAKGLTHQDMLSRELTRRGVGMKDPSIQREWFGKWVVDENSLVYHYNKQRNDYGTLPSGEWIYILGVDLGYEDSDAIAVIAYSESHPDTYVLDERIQRHQDLTQLCAQIDELTKLYPIQKIVVDTGGLGKKITEEISKRYSIPMVAAEKTRKVEYIELMNDALRTGRLKIKASSRFAHDSMKVEWDNDKSTPDRRIISSRFHSDICEAVLYAWRESYFYTYHSQPAQPAYGSEAYWRQQAEMMLDTKLEQLAQAKEDSTDVLADSAIDIDNSRVQSTDRPQGRYHAMFNRKVGPPGK